MSISNYHPTHIVFGKILNGIAPSRRKIISTKRCCNERFRDVFFVADALIFWIYIYIYSYSLSRGRFWLQMKTPRKTQKNMTEIPKLHPPCFKECGSGNHKSSTFQDLRKGDQRGDWTHKNCVVSIYTKIERGVNWVFTSVLKVF